MLAVLVITDHLAVKILYILKFCEIGMGVPAKDEVQTVRAGDNLLVADTFDIPPEMRKTDDEVAFLRLQLVDNLLRTFHRVVIDNRTVVLLHDQTIA